jgi:hypothetical protein
VTNVASLYAMSKRILWRMQSPSAADHELRLSTFVARFVQAKEEEGGEYSAGL